MNRTSTPMIKPAIIVRESDYARLTGLALMGEGRKFDVGEDLMDELDRASVVLDEQMASHVVHMGSTVTYVTEQGQTRTVTLVYPGEADIEQSKVSILTPIGVALLGLSPGQSIDWTVAARIIGCSWRGARRATSWLLRTTEAT